MDKLVSIVIPVYKVEKVLGRCMQSVFEQSYKNLQIILVDDGSPDNCPKICDEYAEKDSRIEVIHKENGGLSSARNEGMKICKGEYIVFLDSDDYLSKTAIEKMLNLCLKNDCEISILKTQFISFDFNEEVADEEEVVQIFDSEKAIEHSLYQILYSCTAWNKMYRKDILDGIWFPLRKISEDLAVSHLMMDKAKKIAYSNIIGYYYRQNPSSIMHNFNIGRMDALSFAVDIEEYCKENYPKIVNASKVRIFNVAVHMLLDLPDTGEIRDLCLNKIWKELKKTRWSVIFNKKARFREKAAAILTLFGEKILKKVWRSRFAVRNES